MAQEATWPVRPIHVIVPAPAGGPFDLVMRPVAAGMSAVLKQPVVIDNRPSASNVVGTRLGANAAPDGYTLTMTGMVNTVSESIRDKPAFDIVRDFAHIGAIGESAQWLLVRSDSNIDSIGQLIRNAQSRPGRISVASSGVGSAGDLVLELLEDAVDASFNHVPYRGGGPALQDLAGGQVDVAVVPQNIAQQYVEMGRLKALAVTSSRRSASSPATPTFAELGFGALTVTSWVGLSAPRDTPAWIVNAISDALLAALANPSVSASLEAQGLTLLRTTPAEYGLLVAAEQQRWQPVVRRLARHRE